MAPSESHRFLARSVLTVQGAPTSKTELNSTLPSYHAQPSRIAPSAITMASTPCPASRSSFRMCFWSPATLEASAHIHKERHMHSSCDKRPVRVEKCRVAWLTAAEGYLLPCESILRQSVVRRVLKDLWLTSDKAFHRRHRGTPMLPCN